MTIKYNNNLTVETIGDPVLDNYKDSAAYYWTAYNPDAKDDLGLYDAYRLVYIVPDDMTDTHDINWTDPDDIQSVGGYDPDAGRII